MKAQIYLKEMLLAFNSKKWIKANELYKSFCKECEALETAVSELREFEKKLNVKGKRLLKGALRVMDDFLHCAYYSMAQQKTNYPQTTNFIFWIVWKENVCKWNIGVIGLNAAGDVDLLISAVCNNKYALTNVIDAMITGGEDDTGINVPPIINRKHKKALFRDLRESIRAM